MLPAEWKSDDLGRPVKGVAWGMLARMYMFLGQWNDVLAATQEAMSAPTLHECFPRFVFIHSIKYLITGIII